ncbi:MAG: hypothetical protein U1E05_18700 [Patescibacteria group bacterium]|nr:hypothetical protein [Patescibacteria group bacterium]
MVRRTLPLGVALIAALWAWQGLAQAQAAFPTENTPASFYNYYVAPASPDGVGAELYLSPRPVPPLVGHTYITYEPLSPHEFLYRHSRTYWRYNPGAGWTRARINWR